MADQENSTSSTTDGAVEIINVDEKDENAAVPVLAKTDAAQLTALSGLSGLMQNPEILAALQDKLGSMVGGSSGYIQSLPKVVKRRIKALKKLQNEMIQIESKFYEEVHELECKYAAQYTPLYDRRKDVVGGTVEPTDSDCDWPSDEEDDDEVTLAGQMNCIKLDEAGDSDKTKENVDKSENDENEEKPDGVPQFWLTIFKNVDMLAELVQEHDEPILENLTDLQVTFSQANPMGFTLHFHFAANDFFTNTLLTKSYVLRSTPDETDPFSFEGPEIIKCEGCKIDWKKGKNVTVKVIKKVQKHQSRGTRRTVTKTVQNDSFFNFFSPPEVPEGEEEADEDTEALLAADFELGHFLRERIIPRAVLYFTGEALEDDDYDDEEEEGDEEGEDEDGEYDEEADADFVP